MKEFKKTTRGNKTENEEHVFPFPPNHNDSKAFWIWKESLYNVNSKIVIHESVLLLQLETLSL